MYMSRESEGTENAVKLIIGRINIHLRPKVNLMIDDINISIGYLVRWKWSYIYSHFDISLWNNLW